MYYIVFQAIADTNDFQFTLQLTYVRLYNITLQCKYSSIWPWSDFLGWLPSWLMKVIALPIEFNLLEQVFKVAYYSFDGVYEHNF